MDIFGDLLETINWLKKYQWWRQLGEYTKLNMEQSVFLKSKPWKAELQIDKKWKQVDNQLLGNHG